jgi:DNA-binding transcriptional LysR family regulator
MGRRFRYKDLQLPQLRSFCLAATQGNFTAAAKVLGLSAPTVWEQVRGLERRLGANLLIRRGRNVELTAEGQLLLRLVQPHVTGLDSLERLFADHRTALPQRLSIASTPYMLAYHLVEPVQQFARQHPSVMVSLRPSVRLEEGMRLIERGQADVGVLSYNPNDPPSPDLCIEELFELYFTLLTTREHPLARKKKVTPHDLVQYPIITQHEGTHSRLALDRLLRRHQLAEQAHLVLESSHFDVIRSYVASGIGVAALYLGCAAARAMPNLHLRVFDPGREGLPVALVTRRGAHLAPAVEDFRAIVRSALKT